jgi:hypothetical protein
MRHIADIEARTAQGRIKKQFSVCNTFWQDLSGPRKMNFSTE